ncbi:MAG: DUF4386 domain-containing protein [Spirochaetaceae bacterium]
MKNRSRDILIGVFILLAYLIVISGITDSRVIVFLGEVISGLSVIGIAVLIKPVFIKSNVRGINSYYGLKILEGITMIITGFIYLFFKDSSALVREIIFEAHSYVFILCAFIFYLILYRSKLIPRAVSIWGLIAVILLFAGNIFQSFDITIPSVILAILFAPIMLNEIFISIWLFVKGLKD